MKTPAPRKTGKAASWPRKIKMGRATITVYKRAWVNGGFGYFVASYASGKRKLVSYAAEADALDAAHRLARQMSEHEVVAASLTNAEASDYASAVQALAPFKVALPVAVGTLVAALKLVGDLPNVLAAAKFYAARHRQTTPRPVAAVVAELLTVKEARRASKRYLEDLRSRLGRFAADFKKDTCAVTTAEIQAWLDSHKLAPQTYTNFRRVLHGFFEFAVARGYAADNPAAHVENLKTVGRNVAIFTPAHMAKLLAAAAPEFLPALALGAFAGLRSAEIERLEWSDLDLAARHLVIGADKAKTASRRVVPICDNLAAFLTPYAGQTGLVWPGSHEDFYAAQQTTSAAAGVPWKSNALRHSYASYRFSQTADAGRVAGELGNSAAVVHKHYRELVKPDAAAKWFALKPATMPANIVQMPVATAA